MVVCCVGWLLGFGLRVAWFGCWFVGMVWVLFDLVLVVVYRFRDCGFGPVIYVGFIYLMFAFVVLTCGLVVGLHSL